MAGYSHFFAGDFVKATNPPGVDTFVAGDLLGTKLSTFATFAPITTDLEVSLEVAFVL